MQYYSCNIARTFSAKPMATSGGQNPRRVKRSELIPGKQKLRAFFGSSARVKCMTRSMSQKQGNEKAILEAAEQDDERIDLN